MESQEVFELAYGLGFTWVRCLQFINSFYVAIYNVVAKDDIRFCVSRVWMN
jgi:hypothetical protein